MCNTIFVISCFEVSSSTIAFYRIDYSVFYSFSVWKSERIWIGAKYSSLGFWQWHGKSTGQIGALPWGPDEPNGSGSNRCIFCSSDEDFYYDDNLCTLACYFACELTN